MRQVYRSAGWPCHDIIEIDLIAAALIERRPADGNGVESLRVTDQGLRALEGDFQRSRAALDRHDALVARVAAELTRDGRVVFRSLTLRARSTREAARHRWQTVRPDVYSIRSTPFEARLAPTVHEIKVSRADLLADLKRPEKRLGYQAVSQQCYYVIAEGIAEPDEIPTDCGVLIARSDRLERARLSPVRELRLTTLHWVAMARAQAESRAEPDEQWQLGSTAGERLEGIV